MIYLDEKDENIVKEILHTFSNYIENVYAFGSRVRGDYKKYSDLDLAIKFKKGTPKNTILFIKDAFENSTLPINVDVLDLDEISDEFRNSIHNDLINMI